MTPVNTSKLYPNAPVFGLTLYNPNNDSRIVFEPLLSIQRYNTVQSVICDFAQRSQVDTLTEYGCGNFHMFTNYLLDVSSLRIVNQIDLSEDKMRSALHILSSEFNRKQISNRVDRHALIVNVFKGSVSDLDDRMLYSDIVIGIELIEHLFPDDFHKFPQNIFGHIKPKMTIFTTPNYDFNVLFHNGGAFRDPDHKFEFTRDEFLSWATMISKKFDYSFEIYGIGEPPLGHEEVGFATQMVVFQRQDPDKTFEDTHRNLNSYQLIASYKYFDFLDDEPIELKISNQVHLTSCRYADDEKYIVKFTNACECNHKTICLPLELYIEECNRIGLVRNTLIKYFKRQSKRYPLRYVGSDIYVVIEDECENCCNN